MTSDVLIEVADGLAHANRMGAVDFIQQCYRTANIHVVFVDLALFTQGMELYQARQDKEWGLTDCISFVFMREKGLTAAVTADHHFVQAGYRALMLEV